jgi:hypothetical protein
MREHGFIAGREPDGRMWFVAEDMFEDAVRRACARRARCSDSPKEV